MSQSNLAGVKAIAQIARQEAGGPAYPLHTTIENGADSVHPFTASGAEPYYPRSFEGTTDIEFLRDAADQGLFIALIGPPGTGKSAMFRAAFHDRDPVVIVCSESMDETALTGGWQPDGSGGYHWQDAETLAHAMRDGRPVLLEEINAAAPRVLTRANNVFDGNLELIITEHHGERVTAAPGFFAAIAYNPNIPGFELSAAMESRFGTQLEVHTPYEAALRRGVDPRIVAVAQAMQAQLDSGEASWAPQMRELITFQSISDRFGERFAIRNLVGIAKRQDAGEQIAELLDEHYTIGCGTHPLELR